MSLDPTEFERALDTLRDEYARNLSDKLEELEATWHSLEYEWNPQQFDKLTHLAHRLAGSGATFGFANITYTARELELYLRQLKGSSASPEQRAEIQARLTRLTALAVPDQLM